MSAIYQYRRIPKHVFRAYDIRGIIGEQLDEDAFYTIGRVLSVRLTSLKRTAIYLGRDGRLTSDALSQALRRGLTDSGIHVFDLGLISTPMMYFATQNPDIDSGIMITGSHNPSEYNGIKMVLAGSTLANEDIEILYQLHLEQALVEGVGTITEMSIVAPYVQRIMEDIQLKRPLKVVVDCGNGIGGPIVLEVLQKLQCELIPLYCDVDGRFPNHHPDPSVESNLTMLKQAVLTEKADIGLAFDGDADRLGIVTEQGELIWPDRLMMFYALHVLQETPGASIVFDVKCSRHLAQVIKQAGGNPIMCPTGHSIVKRVMKEEQAALAGEMSGHLFFKHRWYGFDDALYSACRLLEIMSQSEQTLSQQFIAIPNSVHTPEIKIPMDEDHKFTFIERFKSTAQFDDATLVHLDGLRVEFADGWGLIRASNTTPCLIARFEAENEQSLHRIKNLFMEQLHILDNTITL